MRWLIKLMVMVVILLSAGKVLAQEQTGSIAVYLQNGEGYIAAYRTDAFEETDPQALWNTMKEQQIQGIVKPVYSNKPTVFTGLPQGRYLVVHEDGVFLPFLVSIPFTVNGTTSFSVEAHPKTQTTQTPQTGDTVDLVFLLSAFGLSLLGMIMVMNRKGKRMTAFRR